MLKDKLGRAAWAWSFYDFANSAFTTSVLSVLFSVYFVRELVPAEGALVLGVRIPAESLWAYMISAVMMVVILTSPPLGAYADRAQKKRLFLIIWTVVGVIGTLMLFGATPGRIWYGAAFMALAFFGYEMSWVFYNGLLNDVAEDRVKGTVSGLGFSLGYFGGGVCLAVNIAMVFKPALFGLDGGDPSLPLRAGVFMVGCWWLLFAMPAFMYARDARTPASAALSAEAAPASLTQLIRTIRSLKGMKDAGVFLLAYLFYNDGIQTILLMASIFGAQVLGMSVVDLGLCYLMIQFIAFGGAYALGRLSDRWGHKKTVLVTLVVFTGVVVWMTFMESRIAFWVLGGVVGLVLGGSQSASRSLFALLIPVERSGEFFAVFSVVGKAAALTGPLVLGVIAQFWGLRAGVGILIVFFVVGGGLLMLVDERRGRAAARPEPAPPEVLS